MHQMRTYPPRIQMTVYNSSDITFVLHIKFDGCASERQLDPIEIMFPLEGN